jgi:predicted naringenin-chalcone synthase
MHTIIESIATANPPQRKSQEDAARFMRQVTSIPQPIRDRIEQIYENTGIDYRYSGIADYNRAVEDFSFFPNNWDLTPAPSTAERNETYRSIVLPLMERVARDALDQSSTPAEQITHVITVSCTGFFAPGPDIELVKRLGMPRTTARTMIGFMGCYAAFNGLRTAHAFCQTHPEARVLLVCAELCTLHFQIDDTLETAVVNALFSDGAAAAVLSGRSDREASGFWEYVDGRASLQDNSMEDMTWDIGNEGFIMGLSPRVSRVVVESISGYLEAFLDDTGWPRESLDFWAVHPGGPRIIDGVQEELELEDRDLSASREVLRQYGNMSSPTVLFVLQRCFERLGQTGSRGVAFAFGPGLTIEGALFERVR